MSYDLLFPIRKPKNKKETKKKTTTTTNKQATHFSWQYLGFQNKISKYLCQGEISDLVAYKLYKGKSQE